MSNSRDEHFSGFAELLLDKMFVTKDYEQYQLLKRIIAQSAYAFACQVVSSTNEHHLRMIRAGMWSVPQCVDQILDMTEWPGSEQS